MNRLTSVEREDYTSLEAILERHHARIEEVAKPGRILTHQRLADIGHSEGHALEDATMIDLGWPDEMDAVRFPYGSRVENYLGADSDKADEVFVTEIILATELTKGTEHLPPGRHGYNNFPALLQATPDRLRPGQTFMDLYSKNPANAVYGTKPYLWRAYMLEPDFMRAVQERVCSIKSVGMADWTESLLRGASSPELYPADATLLRASRLSYHMLMNLMRTDDLVRQKAWLNMSFENTGPIVDPDIELCT